MAGMHQANSDLTAYPCLQGLNDNLDQEAGSEVLLAFLAFLGLLLPVEPMAILPLLVFLSPFPMCCYFYNQAANLAVWIFNCKDRWTEIFRFSGEADFQNLPSIRYILTYFAV